MGQDVLRVLAVDDPAVKGYLDKELGIFHDCQQEVVFHTIPWTDYYAELMEVFTGKTEYDIVMVAGHLWLRDFVENGTLSEIEFEEEDILPVIAKEMRYQGKAYLSPSFCDGHMIVYRKSIISQIMGKELEPVITPLEYLQVAKSLNDVTGKRLVAMKAYESEIFTDALPFLRMYGDDVYGEDGQPVCDSKNVIEGLQAYLDLKDFAMEGTEHFGNEEIADAIRENKAAMAVTWSGQLGVIMEEGCVEPDDLGFSTFTAPWNVTWSFAISSGCRQKDAANACLRYLRSSAVDKAVGRKSGAPVKGSSYVTGVAACPWFPVQKQMMDLAKPLPSIHRSGEKNGILYKNIYQAFIGRKTVTEAMEAARQEIDAII